jgi:KRAB domain-containing zinc finger protein
MSVGHYRRHVKAFHKLPRTLNLACSTCNENFSTTTKLKAHIYKQHPEETKVFACKTCGARFALEKELETHKVTAHPSLRFYICHHCGKVRSSKYAILNHLVNNHSDPVYDTCPVCRAKVVSPTLLDMLCNLKFFKFSSKVTSKMLAHCRHKHSVRTDIKIIKCKYCNKQFKQNCVLRRHLRSHTGERPFVCHVCGMAFIRSGSLKKHFYTHSGERPIHCDLCGKGLYSSHALKIHMVIFCLSEA